VTMLTVRPGLLLNHVHVTTHASSADQLIEVQPATLPPSTVFKLLNILCVFSIFYKVLFLFVQHVTCYDLIRQ